MLKKISNKKGSGAKNLALLQNQCKHSQLGKLINLIKGKIIHKGKNCNPNLAGATAEDVRDIMIEGESGILSCAPEYF